MILTPMPPPSQSEPPRPTDSQGTVREALVAAAAWGTVTLAVLLAVRFQRDGFNGFDAYFHVAAARYVWEHGPSTTSLPWTRISLFAEAWGDKEFLFHQFLIPFCIGENPIRGGNVALCVLNALQAATLAFLGVRWTGRAGALLPLLAFGVNRFVFNRFDLLRPHELSVIVLLWSTYAIGRRRYGWLALLAAMYALSYTAWHALFFLCAGAFCLLWFFRREREPWLIVAPAIGLTAGVLLHPAFPASLRVWYYQNIDYYLSSSAVNVGREIFPLSSAVLLGSSAAGIFLFACAALTSRPWHGARPGGRQELVLGGFAGVFSAMFLLSYRFVEYAAPFLACYAFVAFARLFENPTHDERDRRRRAGLFALLLVLAAAFNFLLFRTVAGASYRPQTQFADAAARTAFDAALPDGAHVAAPWDATSRYVFADPAARYLNVLDPVFMKAVDPTLPEQMDALFAGTLPDPADMVRNRLDSEFIAFPRKGHQVLGERLQRDPRFAAVFNGKHHVVFRVAEAKGFVVAWHAAIGGRVDTVNPPPAVAPPADDAFAALPTPHTRWRTFVGPAAPVPSEDTAWWARRDIGVSTAEIRWIDFSAAGTSYVYLDRRLVAVLPADPAATMTFLRFPLSLDPARTNRIEVATLPGRNGHGFVWRERLGP